MKLHLSTQLMQEKTQTSTSMADSVPLALELTVLSAESLVMPDKNRKNTVVVAVYADSGDCYGGAWQQTTSAVDIKKGGGFAAWNESIAVALPMQAMFVTFEVRVCKKSMMGECRSKVIGVARVPVSDIVGGYVPAGCLQFLSYRLRDRDGEKSGIVNFSVKVKGFDDRKGGHCRLPERDDRRSCCRPENGGGGGAAADGVVTGVPVFWYL